MDKRYWARGKGEAWWPGPREGDRDYTSFPRYCDARELEYRLCAVWDGVEEVEEEEEGEEDNE